MYLIGMTHPSVGSHMTHQVYSIYFVHTWLSLLQKKIVGLSCGSLDSSALQINISAPYICHIDTWHKINLHIIME